MASLLLIIIIIIIIMMMMMMFRFHSLKLEIFLFTEGRLRLITSGLQYRLRRRALPRRAALCKSSILVVTPIASRCLERLGLTAPSAPTTIGTTFALTFQSCHLSTQVLVLFNFLLLFFDDSSISRDGDIDNIADLSVPVHYSHVWSSRLMTRK